MMAKEQAYFIASQWGSYINSRDPGLCFYGFKIDDGRPYDENHRTACIAHGKNCLQRLETGMAMGTVEENEESDCDAQDLKDLVAWFETCPLTA